MKFAFHPTMCPADQYEPLAIAAESVGFDTFTFPDSLGYPQEGTDCYPYNDDGSRGFLEDVPFIEPFVIIPYLAAICKKLRFTTSVYKLAVRQPVVVAKQLSSLAVMTGNRVGFGVGISPWAEDFLAAQIPWEKRGKRMNEMMEIVNGLMTGEFFGYEGEIFTIAPLKICPVPTQRVPLLVGGHSKPGLRRAGKMGDGWIAASANTEQLKSMIEQINEFRKHYQRDHLPFEVHATSADAFSLKGLETLAGIGVTEVVVAFRNPYDKTPDNQSVEEKIGMLKWYADTIIQPCREQYG